VLFGPHLDFIAFPFVALVICVVLAMMSMTYSYVRQRNGLAAAWAAQIVVNLVLMFLPFAFQV
jgi:antibiotic biosynthesis monooxygenase (ABM) superfamily enzyme